MGKPSIPSKNGRNSSGRFVKGNAFGQGRKPDKLAADWRSLFRQSVSEDEFKQIVAALVEAAIAGDVRAAGLVLDRLLGRVADAAEDGPVEVVEPDERFL
jgi:hypothetical protein